MGAYGYGFGPGRRSAVAGGGAPALSPLRAIAAALASTAYAGAVWDFADKAALWQDSAGTTPVTDLAQPAGRAGDLTGRGQHLTQPTAGARPQYASLPNGLPGLLFDGANSGLSLPALDLTSTDRIVVIAGVRKTSDTSIGIIVEASPSATLNSGGFHLLGPSSAGQARYGAAQRGATAAGQITASGYAAPHSAVVAALANLTEPLLSLRVNGAEVGTSRTATGGGDFGNLPIYVGRRAGTSLPFNGFLTSLLIMDARALDVIPGGLSAVETAINAGIGAY